MQYNINNPWFIYPGAPLRGYSDEAYKSELLRLFDTFMCIHDTCVNKTLLHLTIGAPMEEAGISVMQQKKTMFHAWQLIPEHIFNTAQMGIDVICIVVCPNKINNPMFITQIDDFIKIDNMNYKHNILPIKIMIFNTMMPTKDEKRNNRFIKTFIDNKIDDIIPGCVNRLTQTEYDREFVDIFYNMLSDLLQRITYYGGYNSCFSFAVFNAATEGRQLNNFYMFRELRECYKKHADVILCEWVFKYKMYVVYNVLNNSDPNSCAISYVPFDTLINIDSKACCNFLEPCIIDNKLSYTIIHIDSLTEGEYIMSTNEEMHITQDEHIYGYLLGHNI